MLVHKDRKGTLDHFIDQQVRRLHRFPAANPMHRDKAPVTAMDFDVAALFCGNFRLKLGDCHGRRHDVREIVWIAMEGEHGFRTRGEWRVGVKK